MTAVAWPTILKPVDFGYTLVDADISGGQAIGGGEQFIASAGPRWEASMTLSLTNKEQILALRALRVQLQGRVNPVILPNFDGIRLSWPEQFSLDGDPTGVILHPGNTRNRMLDGTAYESPPIPATSNINATLSAAVAIRATTVLIEVAQGGDVLPGQQFGIGQRLYEIGTVVESTAVSGNPLYTCTILPPTRLASVDGVQVLFTRPVCLMRCLNMADEFRKLDLLRSTTLALEFSEYI